MIVDQAVVTDIAARLAARAATLGGPDRLGERNDLEPETTLSLERLFPDRVEKERKIAVPGWSDVGNVDVIVREQPGAKELSAVLELKWCRRGELSLAEAVWDIVKLTLLGRRIDRPEAFLLFGASQLTWSKSAFSDLFDEGQCSVEDLFARDIGAKRYHPVWQAMLAGGYGRYPESVPTTVRTVESGRAQVGAWELRCVAVQESGDELAPMINGWPYGRRPTDEEHR